MAAPPPPHSVVQIDHLVEEFLLRLPPEDPAVLARAALVSRQWYRVITGPVFRRRFRKTHRTPPLLGYIANIHSSDDNIDNSIRFVPMSSFRPRHAELHDVRAVHASHSRVLLYRRRQRHPHGGVLLSVWDPISNELQVLPRLPLPVDLEQWDFDAGVVCAADDDGQFKVVFVGTLSLLPRRRRPARNFSCLYSSEAPDGWSDPIFASGGPTGCFFTGTCVHVGSALYFTSNSCREMFKYDLLTNQMSTHRLRIAPGVGFSMVLIGTGDGRLGAADITGNSKLRMWLRKNGRWEERRAIELHTLLPPEAIANDNKPFVAGFVDTRASSVIFLRTCAGYFAVDLNSGRSKNVGECIGWGWIIPYVSFCTPAPGAVSTAEGP